MLTLARLADELELELLTGGDAADTPMRWVHITELPDPTPWLSGGELLLTTGMQLTTPHRQRALVRRLHEHGLVGLGLGTGFEHRSVPKPLLDEARRLGFPVFEVPYEVPFIAITERAFGHLVNEQYAVLKRGIATHRQLERMVVEERGLDALVEALARTLGSGGVAVLGPHGDTVAEAGMVPREALDAIRAELPEGAPPAQVQPGALDGRALVLPVVTRGEVPQAWLAAVADAGAELGDFERLILQQAATVVALEHMRQRPWREAERRLAGDVLAAALAGGVEPEEVERRLRPFGVAAAAAVLVFALDDPAAGEPVLDRFLTDEGVDALVAAHAHLLCAVVSADATDPLDLAARARAELRRHRGDVRAAVGRVPGRGLVRRGFHEARCALEATALRNGDAPEVASHEDLGSFRLLLSLQDDDALRAYCDGVLGPLDADDEGYGRELVRSLEAFIEQNGHWERAAKRLYCHRHTLRYRIKRAEELTGRDLGRAQDRIEVWLAIRARELAG